VTLDALKLCNCGFGDILRGQVGLKM